jgi:hypothetical protein
MGNLSSPGSLPQEYVSPKMTPGTNTVRCHKIDLKPVKANPSEEYIGISWENANSEFCFDYIPPKNVWKLAQIARALDVTWPDGSSWQDVKNLLERALDGATIDIEVEQKGDYTNIVSYSPCGSVAIPQPTRLTTTTVQHAPSMTKSAW